MKTAVAQLKSVSPYSQSKHHDTAKEPREQPKDYEIRTWRERVHVNENGNVFIPPMAFKNSLSEAAKFMGVQIPGKGKSTYTKHFEAGVLILEGLELPLKKSAVEGEWLFLPSDGIRGSGKRVDKCYSLIKEWSGKIEIFILDEIITLEVLKEHLTAAGQFIGIGRFRPRNNGFYGRFSVEALKWK